MALKRFGKLDEIPEAMRESAIETKDGAFVVADDDAAELREALRKERAERKDADKRARDLTESAADLQRQLDAARVQVTNAGTKTEELLAAWRKERDTAVSAVESEKQELAKQLKQVKLYDKAKAEFLASGGKKHLADAVVRLEAQRWDLDGDTPIVLGKDGKPSTATLTDFFSKEHRAQFPDFYEGTKAAGSDARGGAGARTTAGGSEIAEMITKPGGGLRALEAANQAA